MVRRWPVVLTLATLVFGLVAGAVASAQTAPQAPSQSQPQTSPQTPPQAQTPPQTPSQPPPQDQASPQAHEQPVRPPTSQPGDAFGEEVTLGEKTVIYFSGSGMWDSAFETIQDGFKTVYAFLDKQGIKPAGAPMTIYTATDDSGFQFKAAVPVEAAPANPPQGDIAVGKSPGGKAYKFVHRGSYDAMDATYDAITNFLDEKSIDAKDLFVEQYVTDPLKTPEDKLVVEVYVPVK